VITKKSGKDIRDAVKKFEKGEFKNVECLWKNRQGVNVGPTM